MKRKTVFSCKAGKGFFNGEFFLCWEIQFCCFIAGCSWEEGSLGLFFEEEVMADGLSPIGDVVGWFNAEGFGEETQLDGGSAQKSNHPRSLRLQCISCVARAQELFP